MQIFLSVATFDEPHPHFVKSLLKYTISLRLPG